MTNAASVNICCGKRAESQLDIWASGQRLDFRENNYKSISKTRIVNYNL